MKAIHLTKDLWLFVILLISFSNSANAERVNLKGYVYNNSTPIEGAKLQLKNANLHTYSNAQGYFEIYHEDPSSLTGNPFPENQVHFDGNKLSLSCQNQQVVIDVFDLKGNYISCLVSQNNLSGSYALYPKAYLNELVSSIYLVRVTINNRVFGFKVANNGDCIFSKGLFSTEAIGLSGNENEKSTETVDSLIITHNLFKRKSIAITNYVANMGAMQLETKPQAIPGRVEAEYFFDMSGIQIEDCSEGGKDVGYIDEGDWMDYTVNVSASGKYNVRCRVAADGYDAHSLQVQSNGSMATVNFNGTGGWQNWTDASAKIDLNAGVQTIRVYASSSAFNINYLEFTTYTAPVPFLSGPTTTTFSYDLTWTYDWTGSTASDDHYELEYSYNENSGYQIFEVYANGMRTSPYTQTLYAEAEDVGKTTYFRVRVKTNGNYSEYSNVVGVYCPNLALTLFATKDNTLGYSSDDPAIANTNYWDDDLGVGANYIDGLYWDTWLIWYSALYFDVMNWIEGRTIERATLKLTVEMLPGDWNTQYRVNPFNSSWDTYTITLNNSPSYNLHYYALEDPPVTSAIPYEIDITSIVQFWADGGVNNGIFMVDNNISFPGYTAYRSTIFYSSETAIMDEYKPQLELMVY